jgi:hypothetical protein
VIADHANQYAIADHANECVIADHDWNNRVDCGRSGLPIE